MMTPVPLRSRSPLTQLTTSPRTCVQMITTASLHPQRRRRNHPIPAVMRAAPSTKKRIPHDAAQRRELLVCSRIERPETIKNRASPQQGSCGETGHGRTKEQENAYRSERPDSESRLVRFVALHLLNISRRFNS